MSIHNKQVKKTVLSIIKKKNNSKIVCLTAYDALTAKILDEAGIDLILVGDSLNMVFSGEKTTLSATMEQMIYHSKIVQKAVSYALVIVDMPFLSYQVSIEKGVQNAGRFLQEAGVSGVKLEGGKRNVPLIQKLTEIGIPVMGHLGLTPQSINQFGSYQTQATEKKAAQKLLYDAKLLEKAGCFSLVLEKVPSHVAKEVSASITIPTIGIGAGLFCDGQILVTEDMLGFFDAFKPSFVRRYNNFAEQAKKNIQAYISDVSSSKFPNEKESY